MRAGLLLLILQSLLLCASVQAETGESQGYLADAAGVSLISGSGGADPQPDPDGDDDFLCGEQPPALTLFPLARGYIRLRGSLAAGFARYGSIRGPPFPA